MSIDFALFINLFVLYHPVISIIAKVMLPRLAHKHHVNGQTSLLSLEYCPILNLPGYLRTLPMFPDLHLQGNEIILALKYLLQLYTEEYF